MRAMRFVVTVMVALAVGAGLSACGDDDNESAETLLGQEADMEVREKDGFRFEPDELSARRGQEVRFTLRNGGERLHNFTLSFLDIDQDIPAGQSREIKFTANEIPEARFLSFYCKYHQSDGMIGKINVL